MINRRMKVGNYFFIWHNVEECVLLITELKQNKPYLQLGFEFGDTVKLRYFKFGEQEMSPNKKILITRDCFLFDELNEMIKSIDSTNQFCPKIYDSAIKSRYIEMDNLSKHCLKFHFNFNNRVVNSIEIQDKNNAVQNCIKKSFQKLNNKYLELSREQQL